MGQGRTITVAAAQFAAFGLHEAEKSLAAVERAIDTAAHANVDLLVLPECAYPAYLIGSVEQYRSANTLPPQEFVVWLARRARKKTMHLVCGLVEDVGTHLHNSAVMIDAQGQQVGTYRKSFLWAGEGRYFTPGDRVPVFETSLGTLGMVICADTRAPEIIAKQTLQGAQVIAMPTCWVNIATDPGRFENPQVEFLISARAREFDIPFVCANKFGMETDKVGYCGRSIIVSRAGEVLAEAPGDQEAMIVEKIELPERGLPQNPLDLWESVLSWREPIRPTPKASDAVTVAIRPGGPISATLVDRDISNGVRLLLTNAVLDADVQHDDPIDIVTPSHVGALREFDIARVGCVMGDEFRQFDRVRLLALGGAEIVCVFDAPDDVRLMRARAVENRIFILAVGREIGAAVSPDGQLLAYSSRAGDDGVVVQINVSEAAIKTVAPDTDIWEQRRVEAYR